MPVTGGRLGLWFPALSDNADVPEDMGLLAGDLEGAGLFLYDQGTLAARPVSSAASPGVEGRFYYANDIQKFYYDTGLAWVDLGGSHAGTHHPVTGVDKFTMGLTGALAERPDAAVVADGTQFNAIDQHVLYMEQNDTWIRVTVPAGFGGFWFNNTAPPGWVIYNGSALPDSTGIYADLYAHLGNKLILPDTRGRMLVGLGTNPDVDAIGDSEGLGSVGSRRPKHSHSMAPGSGYWGLIDGGWLGSGSSGYHLGPIQPGVIDNAPVDTPAYITCAWIAKL